jgi:hypothetical protein
LDGTFERTRAVDPPPPNPLEEDYHDPQQCRLYAAMLMLAWPFRPFRSRRPIQVDENFGLQRVEGEAGKLTPSVPIRTQPDDPVDGRSRARLIPTWSSKSKARVFLDAPPALTQGTSQLGR